MGWELLQIAYCAMDQIERFLDLLESEDVTNNAVSVRQLGMIRQ